jgi:dTDP-L-rhamnose 4-epimerase
VNVIVTGGAGFIGTHLTRKLLSEGCRVTVLDNFSSQIHGDSASLSPDLMGHVELEIGDVRDESTVARVVREQDVIVHLAAETGTGQSMYEILPYEDTNIRGTAVLMHCLVNRKASRIRRIVVASSRAVYGEGKYRCQLHGIVYPEGRKVEDMLAGRFETRCPCCGAACELQPTAEDSPLKPTSFYGLTKQVQEQMVLLFAKSLGISGIALRYQNVYGPGQSLKNPYTGILAVFSNLAKLNQPINVFEDGFESRDFVYIDDVVEATWRCIASESVLVETFNVGSGQRVSVSELVREIIDFFASQSKVSISGAFRQGDIRHNVADLSKARELIGFEPHCGFGDGLKRFLSWAASQEAIEASYDFSLNEMRQRGLLHG